MQCCCAAPDESSSVEFTPAPQASTEEKPLKEEQHVAFAQAESPLSVFPKGVYDPPAPKQQDAAAAEEEPSTFEALIDRSNGSLGLYLDLSDGMSLYVCRVNEEKGSPALAYNESVAADRRVKAGDYILSVNGVVGTAAELAKAVRAGGELKLKIRRPIVTTHTIPKKGSSMGLDLQFAKHSNVLCISKVLDGAVLASGCDVKHGDRIVSVNGLEENCERLLEEMKKTDTPDITTSRCAEVFAAYEKGFRPDAATTKSELNPTT